MIGIKKIVSSIKTGSRLRNKIFEMVVLVAATPLIVGGILALYVIDLSHRQDIANTEDSVVLRHVREVDSFIQEIIGIFQLQVSFEQISDIEISQQHFILGRMLEENPSFIEVSFISLGGGETARQNRAYEGAVPREELVDQRNAEKYIEALAGKDYIGPVRQTLGGPLVTIASPVKNRNGNIVSVLTGEVSLTHVQAIFERYRLSEAGYVYLLDRKGRLFAQSEDFEKPSSSFIHIPIIEDALGGQASLGVDNQRRYTSLWGSRVIAAAAPVEALGWAVVVEWPEEDANTTFYTIRNQLVLFVSLALLLAVLISIILANHIVRPINILKRGAARIARGKFDTPVSLKTNDEIEELGSAFNTMMKGLKRLEELKEEFVFVAAHELRTPVTVIRGFAEMALDNKEKLDEDTVRYLGEVKDASDRLNRLVNDLLEVARSDAGRLTIKVAPVALEGVVGAALGNLSGWAKKENITIQYDPPVDIPEVNADTSRINEVMMNLVSNSIKYTLGEGTIIVTHEVRDNDVITHIEDTGIGMSDEAQKKLFQKFYRVQAKGTEEITGTGLGLFIVKQIIEKMGGKIWATSPVHSRKTDDGEEGYGSRFSFSLPRA